VAVLSLEGRTKEDDRDAYYRLARQNFQHLQAHSLQEFMVAPIKAHLPEGYLREREDLQETHHHRRSRTRWNAVW
jgi:hypothetical protein